MRVVVKGNSEAFEAFALKTIDKTQTMQKNQLLLLKSELESLRALPRDSPYLVRTEAVWADATMVYMLMEYLPGGDLMGLLIQLDTFDEDMTRVYMAQAARAIDVLHSHGFVHRDVKPDNLLLSASGHLKLTYAVER